MPDDPLGGVGGRGGDPRPRKRPGAGQPAPGGDALRRAAPFLLGGGAAAALLLLVFPAEAALATRLLALVLSAAALAGGAASPVAASAVLLAATPLLPGLPRLWGDLSAAPLLPAVALPAVLGILAGRARAGEALDLPGPVRRWGGAFLAVAAASAVASAIRGETLFFLLRGGVSPHPVNLLGMSAGDRVREAAVSLAVLVLLFLAVAAFAPGGRDGGPSRDRLVPALAVGWAAAAALALAAPAAHLPLTAPRWIALGRESGTLTDPNALGIASALAAPLFAALAAVPGPAAPRALCGLALAGTLAVQEASGSRSGLLLLLVAGAAVVVGLARSGARARRTAAVAGAIGAAVVAALVAGAPRGGSTARGGLVARVGATLSSSSFADFATQRTLFWREAVATIGEEPVSGCGLGGFPFEFPVRHARRSGPITVTDNATNALLDVAAECGLPALALALAAVVPLLVSSIDAACGAGGAPPLARAAGAALLGLAVASMTGSHLRFPEVALVAALAAARLPRPAEAPEAASVDDAVRPPRRIRPVLVAAGVLGAFLAVLPTANADDAFRAGPWMGAYPAEQRGGQPPFRWLGRTAFRKVPAGGRAVEAVLRNARPDGRPVVVAIDVEGRSGGRFTLRAGETRRYVVTGLAPGDPAVRFRFAPTFVPRELTWRSDSRVLSVQLLEAS